jgi:hypothetical protein
MSVHLLPEPLGALGYERTLLIDKTLLITNTLNVKGVYISGTHLGGYQNDSQQFKRRYSASCGVPRTVKKGQKQFQHHVGGMTLVMIA